ncbi:RNA polymerase sigma factor [Bacillus sp. es.036]|uniref:RNA polymerase sigma factor n=1 Tax=Bacillus sp. es.036 TaxID=1761764 RepID=UPI000C008BD2|nr:RNA polymerase sigma factor [Bacillus sp. es.036]PFG11948.1 RNA polymerase sigma-70 factor (ECF subfamily) [Bacillus sp. es.036]
MNFNERESIPFEKSLAMTFETIYLTHKDSLYRFLFRYTRDEQFSIDLVQDTFVKFHKYQDRYDVTRASLKTYLLKIGYQLMINKIKRRAKWQTLLPFLIKKEEFSFNDSVEKMTIQWAIKQLPEKQRAVILLIYYHDMTQEDTANILDIPVGTVKSRLSTAIKRLRDLLEGHYDEFTQ